ncbi:Na+/H+ antiporter NhaC family protein [Paludifilum halophilum]|uniref:Sodium:proton antiporter n=1 Tax=Paludifilum halophilum TaxID=1642702 RepID=A0A235B4Y2_9BACL|nr:Na+/H+ antiporter NhaC family protein [Paludifilum halophilum]OYD07291.1 sodium:proton antiporter [Paludifilum halophilum]
MEGSIWSLVPFLIVIPLAILTRQVLPGLLAGLLVGAYMMNFTPLGGVEAAMHYILTSLEEPDNLRLLVFLYGFGAFVGLVRVTGGVAGFADWMNRRIRSVRGAFGLTWLSSAVTFMAPDFRIITIGPVMKRIFERLKVSDDKVAFVIDVTSTPLIALIPVGTAFVGYMVGLIADSSKHQDLGVSAYQLLLKSIPFNFFSILILIYALYRTFFSKEAEPKGEEDPKDRPPHIRTPFRASPQVAYLEDMYRSDQPAKRGADGQEEGIKESGAGREQDPDEDFPDPVDIVAKSAQPRMVNLLLPLALLLFFTFFLTWWDVHLKARTFFGAMAQANASRALLEALLITLIFTLLWYGWKKQPIQRILFGFLQGGNEMMGVNVLLALVWALTEVSTDLGFITYTERVVGGVVPSLWIAPVLFVLGCIISYVIGSTFGAWAILMPLGFSLAASADASLPLIAGAVFASGSFGGFASPLSDNTVAMATVMKLPLMKYAHQKLKASLIVGGVSAVLYAVAGWLL